MNSRVRGSIGVSLERQDDAQMVTKYWLRTPEFRVLGRDLWDGIRMTSQLCGTLSLFRQGSKPVSKTALKARSSSLHMDHIYGKVGFPE